MRLSVPGEEGERGGARPVGAVDKFSLALASLSRGARGETDKCLFLPLRFFGGGEGSGGLLFKKKLAEFGFGDLGMTNL